MKNNVSKDLKILMLEDQEEDAGLMDRALSKEKIKFTRIRVDAREDFIQALDKFNPDLILSDHALPQFNSIEALKIVQESKSDIPFIIVTGSVSEEFAVSCIKKGVDDYVLKSNLSRLPLAIKHSINEHQSKRIRKEQDEVLQRQNIELLKINRELDSFVYNISHNLRAPLASVIGLVNIARLDRSKNVEASDQYFDMIGKSTLKLDDTLKEILDFSQNLRTDLKISEVNLKQLCRECLNKLQHLKGFDKIEKQVDVRSEADFYSDNYRLSVILAYIFSNSIKYRDMLKDDQFIRIIASISSTRTILSILDNGVGIHPDHLPNVFDMFVRSNESSDGAGLGLYVVKEVVEKLKGTIEIASSLGEWTRVDITLPNHDKPTS
ncbi:MAG: hybrid sensor histidine kinase/response regulator [Bacteroidetes bacterium]|nr:hybrid sensor histidine kinase/response regulator [Bacteroidota bacterium]